MPDTENFNDIRHLRFSISLQACPYFSLKDSIILQHIIILSNEYKKGCNLSNDELARVHEVSKQTVSNVIAKASKLGWVVARDDSKRQIGEEAWVHDRYIKIQIDPVWEAIGALYCLSVFNPSHSLSNKASDIITKIRAIAKGGDIEQERADISSLISGVGGDIKKFIHTLYEKREYKKEFPSETQRRHGKRAVRKGKVVSDIFSRKRRVIPDVEGRKALAQASRTEMNPDIVDIILLWNEQPNLRPHRLVESDGRYFVEDQTKLINLFHHLASKLKDGHLYKDFDDISEVAIKKLRPSFAQFKTAIRRYNHMADEKYSYIETAKRISKSNIVQFLYNDRAQILVPKKKNELSEKLKYKNRYPFLYCLMNEPKELKEAPFKQSTEHEPIVKKLVYHLKTHGDYQPSDKAYNEVTRHVNRAVELIKQNANGTSGVIIKDLASHLLNCMRNNGGLKTDKLFVTVNYKLVPYLKENRHL